MIGALRRGAGFCIALAIASGAAAGIWIDDDRIASVAIDDDAGAVGLNPAALAAGRGLSLEGSFGMGSHAGQLALRANAGLLGGWAFSQHGDGAERGYAWGHGFGSPRTLAWGIGYRWGDGAGSAPVAPGLDLGFLLRPSALLSIGATGWSVFDGLPGGRGGLAVRPLANPRLELFTDLIWRRGGGEDEVEHLIGASLEPITGARVRVAWNGEESRIQLQLNGAHISLGALAEGGGDGGLRSDGGTVLWRLDARHWAPLYPRRGGEVAEIAIRGTIGERRPDRIWLPDSDQSSFHDLVSALDSAASDSQICAVYLDIGAFRMGLGALQELREQIASICELDKPVIAYLQAPGRSSYYLASAADLVIVPPTVTVELPGMAAEVLFYGGAFEKFGVEADFERIGPYKSAVESYTGCAMSEPFREQLRTLLGDVDARMLEEIADSRGLGAEILEAAVSDGFIAAGAALESGLVDDLGDRTHAIEEARRLGGHGPGEGETVDVAARRYAGRRWSAPDPVVAVVVADGNMVQGESRDDLISSTHLLGARTLARALAEARKDPEIGAVVLRIDSPGGSALAAATIAAEVDRLSEAGKPLVASVASVAASGGYYIMAGADHIVSNPSAVIGSIGIYAGKFVLRDLYQKLGLHKERIDTGRNASFYSDYSPFTDAQRALLRDSNRRFYETFVQRVAEGRELPVAEVDSLGQGRVYSGVMAAELGLIDEIGGLDEALDHAARLAGIEGYYRIEFLPQRGGVAELVRQVSSTAQPIDPSYWTNPENFRLLAPIRLETR